MSDDASTTGDTVVRVLLIDHRDPTRPMTWNHDLAAQFSRSTPGYRIEIDGAHWPDMARALLAAVREVRPPAIAQLSYASIQLARDFRTNDGEPLFAPVGPAIAGRAQIVGQPVTSGSILPAALDHYRCDGEIWAIPAQVCTIVTYANMTMLKAAGIHEIPLTWKAVEAACIALRDQRGGPQWGVTWPNYPWWPQHAVGAQGGLLADHDNGRSGRAERVDLACEEMLAYVRWWRRLHEKGHYLYTSRPTASDPTRIWAENIRAFATGQVALCVSTTVFGDRMAQAAREGGFELGVGRAPYNSEVAYHGSVIGGDALWLGAGLEEDVRDVALAFMEYLNTARTAADRHRVMGYEPNTPASVDLLEKEGWFEHHPQRRVGYDELSGARGSAHGKALVIGDCNAVKGEIVDAMHDILVGGADPAARFAAATAAAQVVLDDYNAYLRAGNGPPALDTD
jgi:sn-glycerol 3-phosphate transport system substrate-binding protein